MKITSKDYALSLMMAVKGKKENEVKNIASKFVDLLIENNDMSKSSKILETFSRLWNKENGVIEADVTIARKLDPASLNSLTNFLSKLSGAKKVKISEKIDENILGGVIVRYDDKVIDKSLKTKIKNLSNAIKS